MSWRIGNMKNLKFLMIVLLIVGFSFAKELTYEGEPALVEISNQVSNIIEFPDKITKALSSSQQISINIQGNKAIVLLPTEEPADLVVATENDKVYTLMLNPKVIPPQVIKVVDKTEEKDKKVQKERAKQIEEGKDYEDKLMNVLKAAVNGQLENYYEVERKVQTLETENFFIEITKELKGDEFGVLLGKIYAKNKTDKSLTERELAKILSKVWRIAGLTVV
ncbi:MAG: hypothetical protein ACREBJ_13035, partial [Nitrosotalea sp.]